MPTRKGTYLVAVEGLATPRQTDEQDREGVTVRLHARLLHFVHHLIGQFRVRRRYHDKTEQGVGEGQGARRRGWGKVGGWIGTLAFGSHIAPMSTCAVVHVCRTSRGAEEGSGETFAAAAAAAPGDADADTGMPAGRSTCTRPRRALFLNIDAVNPHRTHGRTGVHAPGAINPPAPIEKQWPTKCEKLQATPQTFNLSIKPTTENGTFIPTSGKQPRAAGRPSLAPAYNT